MTRTPPEAKSLKKLPGLIRGAVRLVWRAAPRELLFAGGLQALAGVGLAVQLLVARSVLGAILGDNADFSSVLPPVLLLAVITSMLSAATLLRFEHERILGELVGRYTSEQLLEVAGSVDLISYETPEFYDRLQRAKFNAANRPVLMVHGLLQVLSAAFSIAGVVIGLAAIQPVLVPLALVAFVPYWLATSSNSRAFYEFSYGLTANDRIRSHLFNVLSAREYAKELRAYGTAGYLQRRHDALYDERVDRLRDVVKGRLRRTLVAAIGSSLMTGAAIALTLYLLFSGRMSAAEAGTVVWGLVVLGQRLRGVNSGAGSLYESSLFIEDFTSFIALERSDRGRAKEDLPPTSFGRLIVEDVSFTYPESSSPALKGVSLEVRQGETVALVGENGSGKTTLATLLAHLHKPNAGRILWDGRDIASENAEELRRAVAVLFQDFGRYQLTVHENIALGRIENDRDREAVVEAARRAEADEFLAALPDGYDSLLSRMFVGGVDLSVGQWQRVALARAFFRDAAFLIMDEPTAALDARAEAELFESMKELAHGRAVLLISHRFSSVRSADRIYVLHRGQIVEHGTHEELMARGGRYAEMFLLQAAAYLDVEGGTTPDRAGEVATAETIGD